VVVSGYKQPSTVGSILQIFLKDKGYATVCKEWEVVSNWNRVAGERIAGVTKCERVEDGVLYVKTKSAPWRQELSHLKEQIKESIRKETGCVSIKDIVFY
jgi:predicted nucleic acid-binding Zn ribbon protein